MVELSAKEKDLLQRVKDNEDLRPLFFRKVKGIKWFDALFESGYFNPESNPKPVPAKDEGYVNIPQWSAIDYLVKTSNELTDKANVNYAKKVLQFIINTTKYAEENNFSNYRTWWQFSKIISRIPNEIIEVGDMDVIDYWLDDAYERGIIARELGEKWLPELLTNGDEHSLELAEKLLGTLYKVDFVERSWGKKVKREAILRYTYYHANKITEKSAFLSGQKLGKKAVGIFDAQLRNTFNELDHGSWSYIWRPAIEDHEQNKSRDDAENVLVQAYRDSLNGYIDNNPEEAKEHLQEMLGTEVQIIHRLAIHALTSNYQPLSSLTDTVLDIKYISSNYRHEMWYLLHKNYSDFSNEQKRLVLALIDDITHKGDDGAINASATAYYRSIWLAAIKEHGEEEGRIYSECVEIAGTEPEHPDFTSYMSVGWGGRDSPISLAELQSMDIGQLVSYLNDYEDTGAFREPGLEGLVKEFNLLVKAEPLRIYQHLSDLSDLDLAYIYEIIQAYKDLWTEKSQLPWDDIWQKLLEFSSLIIKQERFWAADSARERKSFVANRFWVVSAIASLIECGTKSDEHAFHEKYLDQAEEILVCLLDREVGNEFNYDSDAVSIAINSPRGHCLEALINLTLRSCRLSDKRNGDHKKTWAHYQERYDVELERAEADKPEYEFVTLVTNYLSNFLYMSNEWMIANLSRVFDQDRYQKWNCAMQGYAYVGTIYQNIYQYLKEHGDYLKVLDDEYLKDRVEEMVIQNIAVAYINDFEDLTINNSLVNTLVARNNETELNHLIWFLWTQRKGTDKKLRNKVLALWHLILKTIDLTTRSGRRVASQLCHWSAFLDHIDNTNRDLILSIAAYADESHNSYELLESIAHISSTQPLEAHAIWMRLLERSQPDYPEDAIRTIFSNLLKEGNDGLRKARDAESEYIKVGNDQPTKWLREIRQEAQS